MASNTDTLVQPPVATTTSWWSSTSWFSGASDESPSWPGLQASSGKEDVDMGDACANTANAELNRVGGAGAQNRFAGNSAVPVGTTPARDSNLAVASGWGMTAHGAPVGGAVAHSRFNDRKRGKGVTCDGTAPPLSRPPGHQASVWAFNLAEWTWEHTCSGAKIEARLQGSAGDAETALTFRPHNVGAMSTATATRKPLWAATEAVLDPRQPSGKRLPSKLARKDKDSGGFSAVGGLTTQKAMLQELAVLPLRFPHVFKRLGTRAFDGVLLKGPPGSGKTFLGMAAAAEAGARLVMVTGADVAAGEGAAQKLKDAFAEAVTNAPAILLLDEIDVMCPSRGGRSDTESRAAAQLIAAIDKHQQEEGARRVVILATTSRPEAVDPALRRHGRLGHELLFGPLPTTERAEVLTAMTSAMPLSGDVDMSAVATVAGGRVAADLAGLVTDAALIAVREAVDRAGEGADAEPVEALLAEVVLEQRHFMGALSRAPPSGLRGWALPEVPDVKWEDLGGLEATKRELKDLIVLPLRHPEKYAAYGMRPSSGALLYGPPGCGKTMLAKAVAACSGANFISIRGPELLDKWLGGSEARVRALFEAARQAEPCVMFFDEIDALAGRRSDSGADPMGARVLNQILTEIDGIEAARHVFVLGATNRPEMLDPAIMRPGRLDAMIKVPLPDEAGRADIMRSAFARWPLPPAVPMDALTAATEGMSGADVVEVCRSAASAVIKDSIAEGDQMMADWRTIPAHYLSEALASARRSVSAEDVAKFDELEAALKEGSLGGFLAKQAAKQRSAGLDSKGKEFVADMVRSVEGGRLVEVNRKLGEAEAALATERHRVRALEAALRSAGVNVPTLEMKE